MIGAVVVNYRSAEATARCVTSLDLPEVGQIVVVDNDVEMPCRRVVTDASPSVLLVEPGLNLGYGAAINRGVASLDPGIDHVLVCNPDLVFREGSIEALFDCLRSDPAIGIVGPRLTYPDGTVYPSARREPDPLTAGLHALVGMLAPDNRFSRRYRMAGEVGDKRTEVDWVSGACMLVKRDAFEALGGFDEGYFMYLEDVDLCRRARIAGYRVAYEPSARVDHVQGVSTATRPVAMVVQHHRSAMRFAHRTLTGWRKPLLPAALGVLGTRMLCALLVQASSRRAGIRSPSPRC